MPINDPIVFERIPTPMGILLDDLLGTVTKHLAGRHDQSTHGHGGAIVSSTKTYITSEYGDRVPLIRVDPPSENESTHNDYEMQHQAASNNGFSTNILNLEEHMPDVLDPSKGPRFYGTNSVSDKESFESLYSLTGDPNQKVTIYRGVPSTVSSINNGDWVTLSPSYAAGHVASSLNGEGYVLATEVPASALWSDGDSINEFGLDFSSEVHKHLAGQHDQSTHGRGSDPSIRRMNAGNGLTARQIFENQKGQGDRQQQRLYDAEGRYSPEIARVLPAPIAPKRANFPDDENYRAAFDKYDKDWDDWARESSRSLVSPVGQELLDGTNKGVQKYFETVTGSEWFKERFGDATPLGTPKFSLVTTNNYAGQFAYGFKDGSLFSTFKVNKSMTQHESTILHEIAHYATAISHGGTFESHGSEFAGNLIALTREVMGDQEANRLSNEFAVEGVSVGNS